MSERGIRFQRNFAFSSQLWVTGEIGAGPHKEPSEIPNLTTSDRRHIGCLGADLGKCMVIARSSQLQHWY